MSRPRLVGPRLPFGTARGGTNRVQVASWCYGYPLTQSRRGFGGILAVIPQALQPAQGGYEIGRRRDQAALAHALRRSWFVETGALEALWLRD